MDSSVTLFDPLRVQMFKHGAKISFQLTGGLISKHFHNQAGEATYLFLHCVKPVCETCE